MGKTVFAINDAQRAVCTCPLPRPRAAYIAPLRNQAKRNAWDYAKYYARPIPGTKPFENDLKIDYPNEGRFEIFGADNADALRGTYFDYVILDEYAQISPVLIDEVILPALSDRGGILVAMGTPKGRNHFYDLKLEAEQSDDWDVVVMRQSETGIVSPEHLSKIRAAMRMRTGSDDYYMQEYECSFTALVHGAYFANEIEAARRDKRIADLPINTNLAVHTFWDLGRNDSTAIWFMQQEGAFYHFIDYYEHSSVSLSHYARVLADKREEYGWIYGTHYLPHDANVVDISQEDDLSREYVLRHAGVVPTHVGERIQNIQDGIELSRVRFPRCRFDINRCDAGLKALENFQRQWDDKNLVFREAPLRNWAKHGADAFREFAQTYERAVTGGIELFGSSAIGHNSRGRRRYGGRRRSTIPQPSTAWMA